MNAQSKIEAPPEPFNPMAAYYRERDTNSHLYDLLNRALILMEGMADRAERLGEDVTGNRAFIARAKKEALQ